MVEWLLEGGCFTCPEKDVDVLQFDHTRGVAALPRRSRYSNSPEPVGGWRGMKNFALTHDWPILEKELRKCDIVCANCHARRTAARRRYDASIRELVRLAKGID